MKPLVLLKQYGYPETDANGNRLSIGNVSMKDEANAIYDLQGRLLNDGSLSTEHPKGFYIQKNGASRRIYFSK